MPTLPYPSWVPLTTFITRWAVDTIALGWSITYQRRIACHVPTVFLDYQYLICAGTSTTNDPLFRYSFFLRFFSSLWLLRAFLARKVFQRRSYFDIAHYQARHCLLKSKKGIIWFCLLSIYGNFGYGWNRGKREQKVQEKEDSKRRKEEKKQKRSRTVTMYNLQKGVYRECTGYCI